VLVAGVDAQARGERVRLVDEVPADDLRRVIESAVIEEGPAPDAPQRPR
jgi:hypothetical protein